MTVGGRRFQYNQAVNYGDELEVYVKGEAGYGRSPS